MTTRHVADICLYGNYETGSGWIAGLPDGRTLGNGEPMEGRSFTEAVWRAAGALDALGVDGGEIWIFAPGGERVARVDNRELIPTFGDLKWEPAPVYTISAEAIHAAAEAHA